jgi:hypothetical protein
LLFALSAKLPCLSQRPSKEKTPGASDAEGFSCDRWGAHWCDRIQPANLKRLIAGWNDFQLPLAVVPPVETAPHS